MSDKAAKKRQYILDTARTVFADKGFKSVTMKDIVEACDISRGGLYIYFDSTDSIFAEILKEDSEKTFKTVSGKTAGEKLAFFLNEQKKAILSSDKSLLVAIYEYMFYKKSEDMPVNVATETFKQGVEMVEEIINEGMETGEFYADDVHGTALNIMYVIEGLKIGARTVGVTDSEIDAQLIHILGGLIAAEE